MAVMGMYHCGTSQLGLVQYHNLINMKNAGRTVQHSTVQYTVKKEDFFVPVLLQLRVLVLPNPFLPVQVFCQPMV
jgi:hypothetical protein